MPNELIKAMADSAHVGDKVAVLHLLPKTGPKDALDALEIRTGSRSWKITDITDGYATYTSEETPDV